MHYPIYETGYYKVLYRVRKLATPVSIVTLVFHFVLPFFFPHEEELTLNMTGGLFAVLIAWLFIYAGYLLYVRKFNNLDVRFTGQTPDLSQAGHWKIVIASGFLTGVGLILLLAISVLILVFNIGTLFVALSV